MARALSCGEGALWKGSGAFLGAEGARACMAQPHASQWLKTAMPIVDLVSEMTEYET